MQRGRAGCARGGAIVEISGQASVADHQRTGGGEEPTTTPHHRVKDLRPWGDLGETLLGSGAGETLDEHLFRVVDLQVWEHLGAQPHRLIESAHRQQRGAAGQSVAGDGHHDLVPAEGPPHQRLLDLNGLHTPRRDGLVACISSNPYFSRSPAEVIVAVNRKPAESWP